MFWHRPSKSGIVSANWFPADQRQSTIKICQKTWVWSHQSPWTSSKLTASDTPITPSCITAPVVNWLPTVKGFSKLKGNIVRSGCATLCKRSSIAIRLAAIRCRFASIFRWLKKKYWARSARACTTSRSWAWLWSAVETSYKASWSSCDSRPDENVPFWAKKHPSNSAVLIKAGDADGVALEGDDSSRSTSA